MNRFDINIGVSGGHSETITTELNDRVLKHYKTFCTNFKEDHKENAVVDSVQREKDKDTLVYAL